MEAQPAVSMAAHEEVLAEEESVDFGISLPSAHGDESGREELNLSLPSDAVAGSAAAMAPAQAFAEAVRAAVGPEETAVDARREKLRKAKEAAALVGSLSAGGRGEDEAEHRPSSAPPKPAASAPPTKRATAAMPLRRDPAPSACRTLHVGTVPARPKVASGASSARRARPTPHTASAVAASAVAAMHGVRRSQTATQRAHAEVAAYGAPGPFELESLRDEVTPPTHAPDACAHICSLPRVGRVSEARARQGTSRRHRSAHRRRSRARGGEARGGAKQPRRSRGDRSVGRAWWRRRRRGRRAGGIGGEAQGVLDTHALSTTHARRAIPIESGRDIGTSLSGPGARSRARPCVARSRDCGPERVEQAGQVARATDAGARRARCIAAASVVVTPQSLWQARVYFSEVRRLQALLELSSQARLHPFCAASPGI